MPTYLVTYHNGGPMPTDPAAVQQMEAAFGAWLGRTGGAVTDPGAPLGPARAVSTGGVQEAAAAAGGYTLLQAASLEAAVRLVQDHPFIQRGGTLHVQEAMQLPG